MAEVKIQMDSSSAIQTRLGFGHMGRVQRFVDTEIARRMDRLVPMRTGALKNSVQSSVFGSGRLIYNTPYAKAQYYKGKNASGLDRGRLWAYRYQRSGMKELETAVQRFVETSK